MFKNLELDINFKDLELDINLNSIDNIYKMDKYNIDNLTNMINEAINNYSEGIILLRSKEDWKATNNIPIVDEAPGFAGHLHYTPSFMSLKEALLFANSKEYESLEAKGDHFDLFDDEY